MPMILTVEKSLNSDHKLTYGIEQPADFRASCVHLDTKSCSFCLKYSGESFKVKIPLCGLHNVYNSLAALAVVSSLGFSLGEAVKALLSCKPVEGKLQRIYNDIFVDYAHTPSALQKVIMALKSIGYREVICVFGCGGDRDRGKRRLMGEVACRYAEFSFITSDNPRSEEPLDICRQIEQGFKSKNYALVVDRKEAIKEAMLKTFKDRGKSKHHKTCLLVAGKGHEDYQIIDTIKKPFKDSRVIRRLLKEELGIKV